MDTLTIFNQHRGLLFSIAYNMLGSVMDAEDIVQETYLRWQVISEQDQEAIQSPKAYLSTIATRLCINQLNSAKVQREDYIGPWLPEPIVTDPSASPEKSAAAADALSMAFLVILESLSPAERAVFLLRQVFDYGYDEISRITGKSEANCRQIFSRAQKRIIAERPHLEIQRQPLQEQQEITDRFLQACLSGDIDGVLAMLGDDVILRADGGGKRIAARNPIYGAEKVARYMVGVLKKVPQGIKSHFVQINGQIGIVTTLHGKTYNVLTLEILDGRIQSICNVINPDKLARVRLSEEE